MKSITAKTKSGFSKAGSVISGAFATAWSKITGKINSQANYAQADQEVAGPEAKSESSAKVEMEVPDNVVKLRPEPVNVGGIAESSN